MAIELIRCVGPRRQLTSFEQLFDGYVAAMSENNNRAPAETPEKDPSEWATGDEPMTGPQRSYLNTLAQEAGVEVPDTLTKAEASKTIDELQEQTGRGA